MKTFLGYLARVKKVFFFFLCSGVEYLFYQYSGRLDLLTMLIEK